jgi:hypothetical protein
MGLMDILQHYAQPTAPANADTAQAHYDEVSKSAPPEVMGQGLGDAFRADHTPPFGQMVGQLFGQSDPQQRAGVLNQLLGAVGPGVLASLGGGMLARLGGQANTAAVPQLTPQQASQLTPEQVQEIATHAQQHDPSVVDKIGGIYAQHPQLVKTLGSAALAVVLAGVANRMRK